MLNRSAAYALEAVLVIAAAADEPVRANDIAARLDLPANYLGKILNTLARAGILVSGRGPTGGFRLGRTPESLSIADVISQFEDIGSSRKCLLGRGQCSDRTACPAHEQWKKVSIPLFAFFADNSIADIMPSAPRTRSSREPSRAHTRRRR